MLHSSLIRPPPPQTAGEELVRLAVGALAVYRMRMSDMWET
jgi:hypothetical protein